MISAWNWFIYWSFSALDHQLSLHRTWIKTLVLIAVFELLRASVRRWWRLPSPTIHRVVAIFVRSGFDAVPAASPMLPYSPLRYGISTPTTANQTQLTDTRSLAPRWNDTLQTWGSHESFNKYPSLLANMQILRVNISSRVSDRPLSHQANAG